MNTMSWNNKPVVALLLTWGIVTRGDKKYLVGKDATGLRYQTVSLTPSFERWTGNIVATTNDGSIFLLLEGGRNDEYAESRFKENPKGLIGLIKYQAGL